MSLCRAAGVLTDTTLGVSGKGDRYSVNSLILLSLRREYRSSLDGSADVKADFAMLLDLIKAGTLGIDHGVTHAVTEGLCDDG